MNYDMARERKDEYGEPLGVWHWTTMRDGLIRPAPPCDSQCVHNTPEAAERHFYSYSLSRAKEFHTPDEQNRCGICSAWSDKGLWTGALNLITTYVYLCDEHRTTSWLASLFPFKPGLTIIHS